MSKQGKSYAFNETMKILAERGKGKAILAGMESKKVNDLYDAKLKESKEEMKNLNNPEMEDEGMGM